MSGTELILDGAHLAAPISLFMVYGVALIPGLAVIVAAAVRTARALRRARVLDEALDGARRPLRAGPAIVRGRVELLGAERKRPDFAYAEEGFALRLASGEALDVDGGAITREPRRAVDDAVVVRDGEELFVRGELVEEPDPRAPAVGGYRAAPSMRFVLVGTGEARTVVITSAADAPRARARREAAWIGWASFVLVLAHLPVAGYHVRRVAGEVSYWRVTRAYEHSTPHHGRGTLRSPKVDYELLIESDDENEWVKVSEHDFFRARVGDVVPRFGIGSLWNPGREARANLIAVFMSTTAVLMLAFRYRNRRGSDETVATPTTRATDHPPPASKV